LARGRKNILFITHDTNRAGAPILMLRLMQLLKTNGYGVRVLIRAVLAQRKKHTGSSAENYIR
jgi:hypothetical protein